MLEINVFRILLSLFNIPVRPEEPSSLICLLITAFPILLKLSSDIPPTSAFFLAHVPFPPLRWCNEQSHQYNTSEAISTLPTTSEGVSLLSWLADNLVQKIPI